MFAFIARQPILDREIAVYAYELLFRDGKNNCYPDIERDEATSKLIAKNYLSLGLDDISCNKKSFINFQSETLFTGFPSSLNPDRVVIELGEGAFSHNSLLDICKQVQKLGYQLALEDYQLDPKWNDILPYVHMVKVNTIGSNYDAISESLPRFVDANIKLIAENVETQLDIAIYRDMGFDYFQGYFYARPGSGSVTEKDLPTSKLNLIELIGASSSASFHIDNINDVIEHDVSLSYMLLRFINNPIINKRYKISSLKHALNYMGEVEIKKFIALLALTNLSDGKPIELLHLSLVRAKFCDLIATETGIGHNPPAGFLVGLFSLLDALLDQDMASLLVKMPLVDDVKMALSGGQNNLSIYLVLVKAFESGSWQKVIRIAGMLEIDQKRLHSLFNQAIVWGNSVRKSVSPHFPKSQP
jgi:EAL and modified HD-GYP domain-containing signal transduction protein